jgi:hypothetical protein
LVALASTPTVGSTYRVTLSSTSQTRFDGKLDDRTLAPGATTVDVKVLEMDEGIPTRLSLTVVRSDVPEFQAASGGELVLAWNAGELTLTGGPPMRNGSRVFSERVLLASLISPDPVVAVASAAKAPCSKETLSAMGVAAARLANRSLFDATMRVVDGASATCVKGKDAETWSVTFSLLSEGARDTTMAFTGTVTVPKGAWRANADLKGIVDLGKAPGQPRVTGSLAFSSKITTTTAH